MSGAKTVWDGRARSQACFALGCECAVATAFTAPFPADRERLARIYSKGDGVVRWQSEMVRYADCIEVGGSLRASSNRKSYCAITHALVAFELGGV
ncbi:MAG: hypothetical protein ACLP01_03065 [Solirubrobacteraceae bacterium]